MPKVTKQSIKKKKARRRPAKGVVRGMRSGSRIVPIDEWEGGGIKINIYGRNGTGKTWMACTFPKPLLVVGFEDGTKTVKKVKGVEFARVQAKPEEKNIWAINELEELSKKARSFKTVVLDTVTSLQDQVLCDILGLDQTPVQSSWGAVSRDQYRKRSERTREFMRLFLDLPIHVVALAQEKDHSNKEEATSDGEVLDPFIASSLGATTCGWLHDACDYICQTFIREQFEIKEIKLRGKKKPAERQVKTGEIEYCLRTLPHPMYACKLRLDRGVEVPDVIVDPSYQRIQELIDQ